VKVSFGPYTKAIVALVVGVLAAIAQAIGNGEIGDLSGEDWVKVALVVLGGSAATWFAANGPAAPMIKAFLGAATAGLTAWVVAFENDVPAQGVVSQGEWIGIALAVTAALTATYQLSNDQEAHA
jgi:hypothetical protein